MDELNILSRAMKLEQDGERFFRKAAEQSSDPQTEKIFLTLADDEKKHFQYIEKEYNALKDGRPFEPIPDLDAIEAIDVAKPIFPRGVKPLDTLPQNPSEEDALLFGLGVEVQTFELYSDSANQTSNTSARELFQKMAVVERGHFDLLMTRYEARFSYPR